MVAVFSGDEQLNILYGRELFFCLDCKALSSWNAKSCQLVIVRRQKCYLRIAFSLDSPLISRQQNCRWWRRASHLHC